MDDLKPSLFHMYRLYFKGFVSEEATGFGVAICDQEDNLLFHIKGSRQHDSSMTALEAELTALKRGLTEAVDLGINHISLYCDHNQIFELVLGIATPEQDTIALLMDDVQYFRQQLTSSTPVLMTRNQAKFANKLAMETVVSKINIDKPAQRKTCVTCLKNDFNHVPQVLQVLKNLVICFSCNANIESYFSCTASTGTENMNQADRMFLVDSCGHQFCMSCMKGHIEAGLLEGSDMRCPHDQCESELTLRSCANILTQELREIWERRIKAEESVLVVDIVRCPNPRCLAIMSKTGDGPMRCCFRCRKPFCINCKVQWHSNMSCEEYKRFRKCRKCQHMFELPKNSFEVITCRCGYKFCYTCGDEWKRGGCFHREKRVAERNAKAFVGVLMFGTSFVIGFNISNRL